jgi:RNA polymerase sigma-70 factor (ECF subfamily)
MWPEASDTQELLEAARGGDAAAVGALLERHRAALRRMVALRMDPVLRQRVDASDIVQEALMSASRRLDEYLRGRPMPFHLWLRQLAKDRLIDAHRRHRAAARRSLDREQALGAAYADRSSIDLARELHDGELTPAAAALRHELQLRFRAALETLSEQDRDIVLMRHVEQLSNQEAAQALGLSEPAAGMRYLRALRRLRAVLGETPSQSGGA